ncbi:MAG: hypothetical protein MJZ94_02965 [Bacteroidales bacterium]|nr:hypothetical protein [Bacteroidales bacterium]
MKQKLIFHVGHSVGFYSELNNMILAILYCQRHNIDFELYSKDANFGQGKGWTDFFLPFCKETKWDGHHYINQRYENPKGGKRKLLMDFYKFTHPHTYLTPDLWNDFRHIDLTEMSSKEVRDATKPIVNEIYRFNKQTQAEIEDLMNSINIDEPYIGFHIRGGDKCTETNLLNVNAYIDKAESLTTLRKAFVSSDDYRNIELIRELYPYWSFVTLTEEDSHGYQQNKYNISSADKKHHNLINMFASMEYLRKAELTFCTFSSNVGLFLGMCMGDKAIGVDFKKWMIW